MPDDRIVEEIATMIRDVRRDDSLTIDGDTPIDLLGVDSLDFVELVFKMEERFDIEIEYNANTDGSFPFTTVGNAANAVRSMLKRKSALA